MPITQRQARQEISKLIEKCQAMPNPDRQTISSISWAPSCWSFPTTRKGRPRKEALLAVHDRFAGEPEDWPRE